MRNSKAGKLKFHRETLRLLGAAALRRAQGLGKMTVDACTTSSYTPYSAACGVDTHTNCTVCFECNTDTFAPYC